MTDSQTMQLGEPEAKLDCRALPKAPRAPVRWNILGLFLMAYAAAFALPDADLTGDLVLMLTTAAVAMAKDIFRADAPPIGDTK